MKKLNAPLVRVSATFLAFGEGGRPHPVDLTSGPYAPHLVVQDPGVREPHRAGSLILDDYLGVVFLDGPADHVPGRTGEFLLALPYWPDVDYNALQEGASFTIREGGQVVGFGTVIEREDPPAGQSHSTDEG